MLCRIASLTLMLLASVATMCADTKAHIDSLAMADDFITASLVVASPGNQPYSMLGHEAIRLQCPSQQLDYCFTFEMIARPDRNFILDFISGTAKGGYVVMPTPQYLAKYAAEGRGATQYTLNLTPRQRQRLWQVLDDSYARGAAYPVDHLYSHCASMCGGAVAQALDPGTEIVYRTLPDSLGTTLRQQLLPHTSRSPWHVWLWNMVIGNGGDRPLPAQWLITPVRHPLIWQHAMIGSPTTGLRPILKGTPQQLLPATRPDTPVWPTPTMVFATLALLAAIVAALRLTHRAPILVHTFYTLLLAAQTLMGLLMLYLWLFSQLPATRFNIYLLVYNPLPLILWLIGRHRPWYRWTYPLYSLILLAMLIATPWLPQATLATQLPLLTLLTTTLTLTLTTHRKQPATTNINSDARKQ